MIERLEEDVGGCQALQCRRRGAIGGMASELLLLPARQLAQSRIGRSESQLPVEPESPRLERLLVLMADLVRIDRKRRNAKRLVKKLQNLSEDPGRFAFAERVVDVETDLDAFEKRERFHVTDRHPVLDEEGGKAGAQGKPADRRKAAKENL